MNANKRKRFIEAFRKACQEHTHMGSRWSHEEQTMVEEPYPYPIPAGKYTIDENFGKVEVCIRCKKCWTDDLIAVAKKIAPKFKARVSGYLSISGFGTAYNFFTVKL